ncbi:hypothetical protein [Clostridium saccharoperbutylacetonicum]|uniref:hypothetical protein n=1 Tax=Clostridium saccharoperbutylacetonicum TaxID=36745 RepID=UPI000983D368|nr:hypothetical protein [Clostridium saccharoperbutylacetonicum]AQR95693.1 hypothetical protein CLSAP_30090 [Clostridium saccharoperbutylacetonicum]NSB31556.1 hypothetical protein [Clostridium saccharoperbutylacetonicum]
MKLKSIALAMAFTSILMALPTSAKAESKPNNSFNSNYIEKETSIPTLQKQAGLDWLNFYPNKDITYNSSCNSYTFYSNNNNVDGNFIIYYINNTTGAGVSVTFNSTTCSAVTFPIDVTTAPAVTLSNTAIPNITTNYEEFLNEYNKQELEFNSWINKMNYKMDSQFDKMQKQMENAWKFMKM